MNGVHLQELTPMVQSTNQDSSGSDTQDYRIQMPDQHVLNLVNEVRTPLGSRYQLIGDVMSGFFGYCFGDAVALFGDSDLDGWKITGGLMLSSLSLYYVYRIVKTAKESDSRIQLSYKNIARHVALFGLMATSGCITNWEKFC